ncbi:MAG: ABC-F family ATP-binding cassette domain-containing protein [Bacillati bacterium ANGP1]|uniref:ABC-F family ATP-binding cassette domain-containing protein n=1 Tax=Candidatus Segetimicrobium genomatis TaxID=2569760 RepID=A0A537LZV4_9BACT|nr:MAG: ABC-F family ATP-binding cassette domain-containing protein [Terrabacteria group bacterium ANGP1]
MPLLLATDLTKSYAALPVLTGAALALEPGEKVALVGRNGVGKTTLLRILAGLEAPDGGTRTLSGGATAGYLPQDPTVDESRTLWDEAAAPFAPLAATERRLADLEARLATPETHGDEARLSDALEEYGRLRERFETGGGFTYEAEVRRTLAGLEFRDAQFRQPLASMSGGQRSRAALARLLLSAPDLLLLDEPTNHLDLDGQEWLEAFLGEYRGAVLLVSHDRRLLDTVTTRTLDLEEGRLEDYPGNYSFYVTERAARRARQQEAFERQQEEIEGLKAYIRRYHAGQKSRQAKSREKRLAKIQPVAAPRSHRTASIRLETPRRNPQVVLRLREVTKRFGGVEVLRGVTLEVRRGEKVGVIGPNGAGKTTLLRLIARADSPTSGTVEPAPGIRVGYFSQMSDETLDLDRTVIDEVLGARHLTPEQVRGVLGRLLFSGDEVHKKIAQLSGGERRRVALAKLVLDRPDILLLDEPTTHLDLTTLEVLEAALRGFPGTMLFVSHDRTFLDRLAERLLIVGDGMVQSVAGSYRAYREARAGMTPAVARQHPADAGRGEARRGGGGVKEAARPASARDEAPPRPSAARASRRQSPPASADARHKGPTVEDLTAKITTLERELNDLSRVMGDPELYRDAARARQTVKRYEELAAALESLRARLSDRPEGSDA